MVLVVTYLEIHLKTLLIMSSGLGIDCSKTFFLTADMISCAVDSGGTSGNKLGKLTHSNTSQDGC